MIWVSRRDIRSRCSQPTSIKNIANQPISFRVSYEAGKLVPRKDKKYV